MRVYFLYIKDDSGLNAYTNYPYCSYKKITFGDNIPQKRFLDLFDDRYNYGREYGEIGIGILTKLEVI